MGHRSLRSRQHGVTFIEMIVALLVLGILTGLAVPSFSGIIASQRVKAASSDLYTMLVRARSEAIKRNADVTIKATGGNWQQGWAIQNPANAAGALEVHDALKAVTVTGPGTITYTGNGRLRASAQPRIDVSSPSTSARRCVSADLSGRPYLKPSAC